MSKNNEVEMCKKLLCGQQSGARFKNSNLIIIDKNEKSVSERYKNNISPPMNINDDYYEPHDLKRKIRRKDNISILVVVIKLMRSNESILEFCKNSRNVKKKRNDAKTRLWFTTTSV